LIRYRARWVLPITTPPIQGGVVGVEGDRIVYVGEAESAPPGRDLDLGAVALLPGLVNAHCHLELTVMRGFLEGLDFNAWINRLWRSKTAVLNYERMLDSARLGILEGLQAGITTYADTASTSAPFEAMLEAGVRGVAYQEVFGPDPADAGPAIAGLRDRAALLRARETPLVQVGISPHAPYTVSDALFRAVAEYARESGLPVAVHIAESGVEQSLVTAGQGVFADGLRERGIDVLPRGRTPVELLHRTGILDRQPLLIHCVRLDEADIALVARTSTVAHCPISNAKLGHGVAPLLELLRAGAVVGLGTDSVASNDRMSILDDARAACLAQSARARLPDAVAARTALELATIGGAKALGLGAVVGSLEQGKQADLAAFPVEGFGSVPLREPETQLVHGGRPGPATFVTVAGRVLVEDGELTNFDPALAARVQRTSDLLQEWLLRSGMHSPHGLRELS
jgi:cytosine/adenosine deaminase-related metal-dependent hydrolase